MNLRPCLIIRRKTWLEAPLALSNFVKQVVNQHFQLETYMLILLRGRIPVIRSSLYERQLCVDSGLFRVNCEAEVTPCSPTLNRHKHNTDDVVRFDGSLLQSPAIRPAYEEPAPAAIFTTR